MCCLCVLPCLPQWAVRVYVYGIMPRVRVHVCMPVCVTMPTTVSSEGTKHHLLSSIPENQKILPTTHRAATIQSAIDSMNIGWICRETTYGNTAILSHTIASFPGHTGMGL